MKNGVKTKSRLIKSIYKPLILITIYTLLIIYFNKNRKNGLMFIVSVTFGFLLKYGNIDFTLTFNELIRNFKFYNLRLLFLFCFSSNIFTNNNRSLNICPLLSKDCSLWSYYSIEIPIGISLILGGFISGIGMILATCCASGAIVQLGSGDYKALLVLIFFIIGSTIGSTNTFYDFYSKLPKTQKPVLIEPFIIRVLLILLYLISLGFTSWKDRRKANNEIDYMLISDMFNLQENKKKEKELREEQDKEKKIRKFEEQVIISILLGLTFSMFYLCFGYMMEITKDFPALGVNFLKFFFKFNPMSFKTFISLPEENPLRIMNFNNDVYIFLGAFFASSLQGIFGKTENNSLYYYIRSSLGGILMGIGSKLSGCTITGIIGGFSSNSLHGIVWMFSSIIGCWFSIKVVDFIEKFMYKPKKIKKN